MHRLNLKQLLRSFREKFSGSKVQADPNPTKTATDNAQKMAEALQSNMGNRVADIRNIVVSVRERKLSKEDSIAELKKGFDGIGLPFSDEELEVIYSYGQ